MIHWRKISQFAVLVSALATPAATLDHAGWFPFYMPWNDSSGGVTDLSWSLPKPAGAKGFLRTTPSGQFKFADSPERVRFTGFVSVAEANFPDSVEAIGVAARLARSGINMMRVHLMDVNGKFGVFENSGNNTIELSETRLRRMDWFLKCLRDRGIYYNFCVQAGRVFKIGDTLDAPVTNDQSKLVTIFEPRLLALQKRFAAQIAQRVNVYTGLSYAQDPAVVSWELTNENQLFMGWLSWGSSAWDSASEESPNGMHPASYRRLDTLWSQWLRGKYGQDSVVKRAWAQAGDVRDTNLIPNPSLETDLANWSWWASVADGASMTVKRVPEGVSGSYAMKVDVPTMGALWWHAAVYPKSLSVERGKSYRWRFYAKGTVPTSIQVEAMKEHVWTWYGATMCPVTTNWGVCEGFFTAPETLIDSLRINLDVGLAEGSIYLDSLVFEPWNGEGLADNESILTNSVKRSSRATISRLSDARARDEAAFYMDVESTYVASLRSMLRDSLKIQVPITFTNNWYGLASIASQAQGDYMDAHWYWDHPSFPNGWSATDYSINNKPMVTSSYGGTIPSFSLSRVAGKPFVGSEYNHPWPNQYLCEAPAFYFGYLGYQDADGALLHAYIDYSLHYKDTWNEQFFNIGTNPVLMTQLPLAYLFRTGKIRPTTANQELHMSRDDVLSSAKKYRDGNPLGSAATSAIETPVRWGSFAATTSSPLPTIEAGNKVTSNTQELDWDRSAGVLQVDNPWWQGVVGYTQKAKGTSRLKLLNVKTTGGRDFAAVHLVSTDSLPLETSKRILLLASARVENKGTTWNSSYTALTKRFGSKDTVMCEPVKGWVGLRINATDSVSVWELDPTGQRVKALGVNISGDTVWTELTGTTLWYEVARHDKTSPTVGLGAMSQTRKLGFQTVRRGNSWTVLWNDPSAEGSRVHMRLVNSSGRVLARFDDPQAHATGEWTLPNSQTSGIVFLETTWVRGGQVLRDRKTLWNP